MDAELLKNPWVIGIGVLAGVVLLSRGKSSSGPDYSPIIATNALAAQTSVQLSAIQAQVIDSNNKVRIANYGVDGAVIGKIVDNNAMLAISHDKNVSDFKLAKLQNELGFKTLDTTLEAHRLSTDLATKQATYKYQVDSVYAANAPAIARDMAQISANTTIQTVNRQAAASENIARINADSMVKQSRQRADSDTIGSVLDLASSAFAFF